MTTRVLTWEGGSCSKASETGLFTLVDDRGTEHPFVFASFTIREIKDPVLRLVAEEVRNGVESGTVTITTD
jgi:hypothetical protein